MVMTGLSAMEKGEQHDTSCSGIATLGISNSL